MDSAHVNSHQAVHKLMHSILFIIFVILQFKKIIFGCKMQILMSYTRDSFPEKFGIEKTDSNEKKTHFEKPWGGAI